MTVEDRAVEDRALALAQAASGQTLEATRSEAAALELPLDALPSALLGVLQRSYLDTLDPADWVLAPGDESPQRPMLREIVRLGRHRAQSGPGRGLSSLLVSCAAPGHALISVIRGEADRQRLLVGVRRLPGAGAATVEHLERVTSAFQTNWPGLAFKAEPEVAAVDDLDELACCSVLTGIPSLVQGNDILPTLEPVLTAARGARFQVSIVAEPLDRRMLDQAIDGLRRIRSEIHSLVRHSETTSRSESQGGGSSRNEASKGATSTRAFATSMIGLGTLLRSVPMHALGAGAVAAASPLGMIAGPLGALAYVAGYAATSRHGGSTGEQTNWSTTSQTGSNVERLDAIAEACEQIVLSHLRRLERASAGGLWRVAIYLAAANEHDLQKVEGALRGVLTGEASHLDPIRATAVSPDLVRDCMRHGRMIGLRPVSSGPAAPDVATAFDQLATCLASHEAAHLFALPENELPGLPLRERAVFALTPPAADARSIVLGRVQDQDGNCLAPLPIRASTLNRNAMVVGLVGSGKSTTCQRLLTAAYKLPQSVPFLVIEPVKTEYRALATYPGLGGRLSVFSAGTDSGSPLRLNPLEPVPGFPMARHVDLLKAVFNAAFPLGAGMDYVLEEALIEVYAERGWSLRDDEAASSPRTGADRAALLPDLRALHRQIDVVLDRKGYGKDIQSNLGAALRSRVNSLLVGQKGHLFDVRRSTPAKDLLGAPAVVELHRLGDDDEKAFTIALIFVLLCEYAEVRQAEMRSRRGMLQHLTLIEEAHRLLAAPRGASGLESADARGKAVRMFTDLLAELRAYGEGFIVAEQIPTKIAADVLKNTALKITHRLTSPDDRQAMGGSCNLTGEQTAAINLLQPGEAIVHDADIGGALFVKVDRLPDWSATPAAAPPSRDRDWLRFGGGCEPCETPCRWRGGLNDDGFGGDVASGLAGAATRLLRGEALPADDPAVTSEAPAGRLYCATLQALRHELEAILRIRHVAMGGRGLRPKDRIAVERALTALGGLVLRWARGEPIPAQDWRTATASIQDIVTAEPPRGRRGCKACPEPCKGLLDAAHLVAQNGAKDLRALVHQPYGADLRVSNFDKHWRRLIETDARDETRTRVSGYCTAVLLAGARPSADAEAFLEAFLAAHEAPSGLIAPRS